MKKKSEINIAITHEIFSGINTLTLTKKSGDKLQLKIKESDLYCSMKSFNIAGEAIPDIIFFLSRKD